MVLSPIASNKHGDGQRPVTFHAGEDRAAVAVEPKASAADSFDHDCRSHPKQPIVLIPGHDTVDRNDAPSCQASTASDFEDLVPGSWCRYSGKRRQFMMFGEIWQVLDAGIKSAMATSIVL